MNLRAARVLVTGASGGLGDAIVRACSARGSKLLVTGRNEDALRGLVADTGGEFLVADLADPEDVGRLIDWAGEIDVLVSNAALPAGGEVETFSVEEIDRALQVNLRAPMVLARVFGAQMGSRGRGQIRQNRGGDPITPIAEYLRLKRTSIPSGSGARWNVTSRG